MNNIRCFYFAREDSRLAYNDGRLVRVGVTHSVDGKPELCNYGLHASRNVFDALQYAESSKLYLVDVWGDVVEGGDKLCGKHREYIARFDAESLLFEFARKQAKINIHKIKPYCSDEDYQLINEWLDTGNKQIKSAAWSAAWSAARSAAWSTAWSATRSAESAAWRAARDDLQKAILDATGWEL